MKKIWLGGLLLANALLFAYIQWGSTWLNDVNKLQALPALHAEKMPTVSALPKPVCQVRPMRPRPAVCNSTAKTLPLGACADARCNSKALLEVACGKISNLNFGWLLPNAARITSASNAVHASHKR